MSLPTCYKREKEELKIPSGERPCDVWTLTRLPLELLDDYPSYIRTSYPMRKHWHNIKERVKELAFQAIELRKTNRRYIKWLEDEIRSLQWVKTRDRSIDLRFPNQATKKGEQQEDRSNSKIFIERLCKR